MLSVDVTTSDPYPNPLGGSVPYNWEADEGASYGSDISSPLLSPWPLPVSPINPTSEEEYISPGKSWTSLGSPQLDPEMTYGSGVLLPNWTADLSTFLLSKDPLAENGDDLFLLSDLPTITEPPFSGNTTTLGESPGALLAANWWNVFDTQYLRHSLGWTITLLVAYMIILIMGIIGNCMVILVVVLRPQMRTVTNMFIMNLAVADLFVIVFCVPATLMANVFTPWILGSFMCKGVAYVQGVSVCASAYSLAAISLDRCKAIYRPMERPRGLSKSQALVTICLIWVIALLMTIPWAVIFNVIRSNRDGLSYCVETWENERHGKIYFLVANLICCYSLPLVLITLSNLIIWCHVSHRKVPQDSASAGAAIKRMHRRTRHGVRKMLGIVTLAFLLSWLPLYVLVTRVKFSKNIGETEANLVDILMPFAQWLGSWNSSINPVLYAFLNSKFREMFKSLLPRWLPFVHRGDLRGMPYLGNGTLTNGGHYHGGAHTGTGSYSHVFTARSSMRSSTSRLSCHFSRSRSHYSSGRSSRTMRRSQRTLLVSSFRGEAPSSIATTAGTLHPPVTTGTISALVCNGHPISITSGGLGGVPGNGITTTVTVSNGHALPSTAGIADL